MTVTAIPPIDLLSPAFNANPFPTYARLREHAPVHRVHVKSPVARNRDLWLLTRYDDIAAALKDPRLVKDYRNAHDDSSEPLPFFLKMFEPLRANMLDTDPPNHTRLRGLVHKAFTPARIAAMQARVAALADQYLEASAHKGSFDLLADYARPMPLMVIAEMLGVPTADYTRFTHWSAAVISSGSTSMWDLFTHRVPRIIAFVRYVRAQLRARRTTPRDDLLTALVQAEDDGHTLSEDEAVAMVFLLLVAGHETTVNLIASGTYALLCHRDQWQRLHDDPTLIKTGVEELVRYTCPVEQATERFAAEDMTLHGVRIPRGNTVLCVIGSANRDESVFPDPDTLDLARTPNKHLGFGSGIHYCLGAPLARLEASLALTKLVARFPDLQLAVPPEAVRWQGGVVLRGLAALPVRVR